MIIQERRLALFLIIFALICYETNRFSNQNQALENTLKVKLKAIDRYNKRRNVIKEHCQRNIRLMKVNKDPKWRNELYFDYEHNLIYCEINKVASTTWTTNLMK